jgi:hypothetical protein
MFSRKALKNASTSSRALGNNSRALVTANNARKMREANGFGPGALVTANNARKMREANATGKQLASYPLRNNKKQPGLMSRFRAAGRAASVGAGSANNKLKRFANAKGITNVRAYNKNSTTRNNLMNKNNVLYFNARNKKPVLAYVPMRLRDSNVSALGKILGREYEFQAKGPMGPGHYNKQFVRQLALVQGPNKPNVPMLPGAPNVPMLPGAPNVPMLPGPSTGNNNNALRKRCAALMAEKRRIEEQLRALGCDPKNE